MEEKLSNVLMLPLQEISLRKVAVILWSRTEVLPTENTLSVQCSVNNNTRKFRLPLLFMKKLQDLAKPIQSEIRNWMKFHEAYLKKSYISSFCNFKGLCWTNLGTVDYQKTAEKLISCDTLDILKRYRLACLYCLEDYITLLWENFPEENKSYFYDEEGPLYITWPKLEFCWPYILKGEETKLGNMIEKQSENFTSFNQYAFEYSACIGNTAATEYFFKKLTYGERETSVFGATQAVLRTRNERGFISDNFPVEKRSDVFCYLLSQMTPKQQLEVFKRHPCNVLMCLLDWQWQHLFMDIAERIWDFLTANDYVNLLLNISKRIKLGYSATVLFQEFFLKGNDEFKKNLIDQQCQIVSIFRDFFDAQEIESIQVILRNIDPGDRIKLISSKSIFSLFYFSISRGKWNFVQLCLQEATLSIENKTELQTTYRVFLKKIQNERQINSSNCEELFQYFDCSNPKDSN